MSQEALRSKPEAGSSGPGLAGAASAVAGLLSSERPGRLGPNSLWLFSTVPAGPRCGCGEDRGWSADDGPGRAAKRDAWVMSEPRGTETPGRGALCRSTCQWSSGMGCCWVASCCCAVCVITRRWASAAGPCQQVMVPVLARGET